MLKTFQGRLLTAEHLRKMAEEFPDFLTMVDCFGSSRFNAFKQDNKVKFVTAFHKGARLCLDVRSPEGCTKEQCRFFHACRDFIMGVCPCEDGRCRFSHDLGDERNMACRRMHQMQSLEDAEVKLLLACSVPRLCSAYCQGPGCSNFACPDLHLCKHHVLRRCSKGESCQKFHGCGDSEHNQWVVDTFHMSHTAEPLLFKIVLIHKDLPPRPPQASAPLPPAQRGAQAQEGKKVAVDIFRFLLRTCRGRVIGSGQFDAATRKFPDFLSIVKRNEVSHMFRVFKRKEKVVAVTAYKREARTCLDYTAKPNVRARVMVGCQKSDCPYFHVCRDFIAGSCPGGCGFSHSFREEPNRSLCANLGLDVLSEEELRVLFACSMPRVCYAYNQSQGCREFMCPDLHFCWRQFNRQCLMGSGCTRSHGWQDSEHNQWVLDVYRMRNFKDGLLFKSVLLGTQDDLRPLDTADQEDDHQEEPHPHQELSSPGKTDEDIICENFVWGTCDGKERCRGCHESQRLPYVWQVNIANRWVSVTSNWNSKLEKAFCNFHSEEDGHHSVQLVGQMGTATVSLTKMVALLEGTGGQSDRSGTLAKLRRQSTPSFMQSKGDNPVHYYTRWQWTFTDDSRVPILFEPDKLQATLEEKFLSGQHTYHFQREPYLYKVDFRKMTQTNLTTSKRRALYRRPVFVSEEDVLFGCSPSSPLHKAVPPASSLAVPPHWSALDRWQDVELVKLDSSLDRAEYQDVRTDFYKTLKGTRQIETIYRVQNPGLWDQFVSTRRSMEDQLQREGRKETVEEKKLFHGTDSLEVVRGICVQNFDHRMCGKNATAFGQGAYFARDAKYSDSYTQGDPRYMFRARVLVGDFTRGSSDMKRPPARNGHVLYDSCVNSLSDPRIYVVFKLTQCYPEYLIEYTKLAEAEPASQSSAPGTSRSTMTLPLSTGGAGGGASGTGIRASPASSLPSPSTAALTPGSQMPKPTASQSSLYSSSASSYRLLSSQPASSARLHVSPYDSSNFSSNVSSYPSSSTSPYVSHSGFSTSSPSSRPVSRVRAPSPPPAFFLRKQASSYVSSPSPHSSSTSYTAASPPSSSTSSSSTAGARVGGSGDYSSPSKPAKLSSSKNSGCVVM